MIAVSSAFGCAGQMLYIYVDGNDNDAVEAELVAGLSVVVQEWAELGAVLVNRKAECDESLSGDDLPDWDIGLNFPIEHFGREQVDRLLALTQTLAVSTGREFVVGVSRSSDISEDLVFLDDCSGAHERDILLGVSNASLRKNR